MNFKKISLGLAAAVAVAAGTAVVEAPAQAASLAPGGFSLNALGNPIVTQSGTGVGSTDTLDFSRLNFKIDLATGALSGLDKAANGIKVSSLTLTSLGTSFGVESFSNTGVTEFITGLKLGADDVIFDLYSSSNGLSSFTRANNDYTGYSLSGLLRKAAGGAAIAEATVASLKFHGGRTNIQVETIPTPALLPGLLGMGVAALRKRKGETDEEAAETAEANV